jgi:hypothetical protein
MVIMAPPAVPVLVLAPGFELLPEATPGSFIVPAWQLVDGVVPDVLLVEDESTPGSDVVGAVCSTPDIGIDLPVLPDPSLPPEPEPLVCAKAEVARPSERAATVNSLMLMGMFPSCCPHTYQTAPGAVGSSYCAPIPFVCQRGKKMDFNKIASIRLSAPQTCLRMVVP